MAVLQGLSVMIGANDLTVHPVLNGCVTGLPFTVVLLIMTSVSVMIGANDLTVHPVLNGCVTGLVSDDSYWCQ